MVGGAAVVRASIRDAVRTPAADQRALVPALVDGDDTALDPALEDDFRTTGLTHLTAVSGTNLTLLVGFLLALARWVRRPRALADPGRRPGILGFLLRRPHRAERAAGGGHGHRRPAGAGANGRQRALRGLGVAMLVLLLVQPALAVSAGFALSVLATAGIVLLAPGWRDAIARWLPRWMAEAVAVPAAAQLACTPVIAGLSGQVSLVAVPANLLVAPVVGPATVLGLARRPGRPAAGAGGTPARHRLAGWCVAWIVVVARAGAGLPVAAVGWGSGAPAVTVLVLLCVLVVVRGPLGAAPTRDRRAASRCCPCSW